MKKVDEETYIFKKMAEGDKEAFRFFFDKYYNGLCNFVNIFIRSQEMAEEIVQDIFVYFWEMKEEIKLSSSVKSYLYAASKYKSLNFIRDKKVSVPLTEYHQIFTEHPNDYFDTDDLRKLIDTSINNLPQKCREIFLLSRENGLTYKEIAEELSLSVKTVENQMGIALKKLRSQLRPYYNRIFILIIINILT